MAKADGAVGIFSPLEGRLFTNDWSVDERVAFIALLAYSSLLQSIHGVFTCSVDMLVPICKSFAPRTDEQLTAAIKKLVARGAVKQYAGGVVWIVDRWSYCANRENNYNIQQAAVNRVQVPYPQVWPDFAKHYKLVVKAKPSERRPPADRKPVRRPKTKGQTPGDALDDREARRLKHKGGRK